MFNIVEVIEVGGASCQPVIAARTSPERKARFAALAASRGMSESALLTLLVDSVLERNAVDASACDRDDNAPASDRISLRLRPGDRARLNARAVARHMKPATYVVTLVRAHVRRDAPLPIAELNALKVAVSQLSAAGRHLHQLAHAGLADAGPDVVRHLQETAVHTEDIRRRVAEMVKTNLMSWEADDA